MTIAACYLSADGVVFGADSTTSLYVGGIGPSAIGCDHHYNFAQKIFQVGQEGSLGITMWGLGNLAALSYRTMIAELADRLAYQNCRDLNEIALLWSQMFWDAYTRELGQFRTRWQHLDGLSSRSDDEIEEFEALSHNFSGGFCIGGHMPFDRRPRAFEVLYSLGMTGASVPTELQVGTTRFWGCPNLIERLLYGVDIGAYSAIVNSPHWSGSDSDLMEIFHPYCLGQPFDLPIREAIDWVHASIYTTNKIMKFSHFAPVCGGPVEIAVITTDRNFRWVRHKGLDSAINDGGLSNVH